MSTYSFTTGLFWSSTIIVILYFLRRKAKLATSVNLKTISLLYILTILRVLLPFEPAVLSIVNVRTLNDNKALLLADKGAISYLSQQIPELAIDQLEEKVYFLIPEKLAADEAAVTAMKES